MQRTWVAGILRMSAERGYHTPSRQQRFGSDEPRSYTPRSPAGRLPQSPGNARSSEPLVRPSEEYLKLSDRNPIMSNDNALSPKLLVLDLNGALIYRAKSGGAGKRAAYPRPYLASFLQYLFAPETDGRPRPWEAFVWSSAQPNNVRAMVELGFGRQWLRGVWEDESQEEYDERRRTGAGTLLGVWARDKMGLSASQYNNKTQTTKDLRKLYDYFAPREAPERWSPSVGTQTPEPPRPPPFHELNSLLLDDSPLKAVYQPFNQLVVPEFDKQEHRDSIDTLIAEEEGRESSTQVDQILLGVVGILDELKDVDNIPAWIRAGGLFPRAAGSSRPTPQGCLRDEELPSHGDYLHWYASPQHLAWWIARGEDALLAKGIQPEHGMVIPRRTESARASPLRSPQYQRDADEWRQSPGHNNHSQYQSREPDEWQQSPRRNHDNYSRGPVQYSNREANWQQSPARHDDIWHRSSRGADEWQQSPGRNGSRNSNHHNEWQQSPGRNGESSRELYRKHSAHEGKRQSSGRDGESSRGARGAIVPMAVLAGAAQNENDEREDVTTSLPVAVQTATDTIRRVLSSLPPINRQGVQALHAACELLHELVPPGHIELGIADDVQWRRETSRVKEVSRLWAKKPVVKIEEELAHPRTRAYQQGRREARVVNRERKKGAHPASKQKEAKEAEKKAIRQTATRAKLVKGAETASRAEAVKEAEPMRKAESPARVLWSPERSAEYEASERLPWNLRLDRSSR